MNSLQGNLRPASTVRRLDVSGAARDSSRNSFVRNAMLDRHLKAQTQATRVKAARQRTIRETLLREQEDVSWKSRVKRILVEFLEEKKWMRGKGSGYAQPHRRYHGWVNGRLMGIYAYRT